MKIKDNSVSIVGCSPQILWAGKVVEDTIKQVLNDIWYEAVITSGSEADVIHSYSSLHYSGNALDLRSNGVLEKDQKTIRDKVKCKLGIDFDFVIELNHFHLEYQPKRR